MMAAAILPGMMQQQQQQQQAFSGPGAAEVRGSPSPPSAPELPLPCTPTLSLALPF